MEKYRVLIFSLLTLIFIQSCAQKNTVMTEENKTFNELSAEEERVIINKGTEAPFSGMYYKHKDSGIYVCRRCNAQLFESGDKFDSGCGWPSFDDAIPGAVKETTDFDGRRTEITCAKCGGHLGHVFRGEGFTDKDTRHCVNSVSLSFVPQNNSNAKMNKFDTAIFAGGCFWGVEHLLNQNKGVISVESGYTGGFVKNPGYREICTGRTGHAEAVRVVFDSSQVDYKTLAQNFFEIHDPEQIDGQGPDLGNQYRSEIFYNSELQKNIAEELISILEKKGLKIATKVTKATVFYPAEDYHQDYYEKSGKTPYCHSYTKRF